MTPECAWAIRSAEPDDAEAIAAVAGAAWRATYAAILGPDAIERFVAGAYSHASVRRRLEIADRFDVAVTTPGDEVVGFAEWRRTVPDEAELVATYLLPAWQRRGIGRALHDVALGSYRGRVARLTVQLLRDNVAALAFYRSLGYGAPVHGTWDAFGQSIPDLRLTLHLGEPSPATSRRDPSTSITR